MFDIISIDWGSVRTGLSFGSSITGLAIPYQEELNTKDLFEVIEFEVKKRNTKVFVVGIPTNFKLQDTEVTTKIRSFIEHLKELYPTLDLIEVNENNSSKIGKGLKNKHSINHQAALEICNRYLELLQKRT
jgi:RNase H-fold protein (predicted Holliday junction resolvase)